MKRYRIASFFAGVGGIDLGFKKLGDVIYANEYNKNAVITYENNFDLTVDNRDIRCINEEEIPSFDIMIAGFPCQAFSIAGYRQGFNDEKGRGNLFFDLERIFKAKQPEIIFLENVKNLVSHDDGKTFKIILQSLESQKYYVKYKVLNTMEYGNTPQNRERIYIIAFKDKKIWEKFESPKPIHLNNKITDLIDYEIVEDKYFYTKDNFKYFDILEEKMNNDKTVYQWRRQYVRENKSNVCPTLTANMGTGGHNVPLIITKKGIRKLTPKECFLFQGFPKEYKLPNIANSHLYKQAGNSVSVSVIKRIVDNIIKIL
ncbi:DNA cytosine methyltransferase [Metamycoplasma gateae]|uniref:DNA (cytosine-5-)-methyltransferase n=1 Tax=Metamycoplasma gateae TaxID=35769 RepID=A0ABZ2AI98_9BACT|nr:DNA cytosine methyltransferase [Metamycoplasma gateae]